MKRIIFIFILIITSLNSYTQEIIKFKLVIEFKPAIALSAFQLVTCALCDSLYKSCHGINFRYDYNKPHEFFDKIDDSLNIDFKIDTCKYPQLKEYIKDSIIYSEIYISFFASSNNETIRKKATLHFNYNRIDKNYYFGKILVDENKLENVYFKHGDY